MFSLAKMVLAVFAQFARKTALCWGKSSVKGMWVEKGVFWKSAQATSNDIGSGEDQHWFQNWSETEVFHQYSLALSFRRQNGYRECNLEMTWRQTLHGVTWIATKAVGQKFQHDIRHQTASTGTWFTWVRQCYDLCQLTFWSQGTHWQAGWHSAHKGWEWRGAAGTWDHIGCAAGNARKFAQVLQVAPTTIWSFLPLK